MRNQIISWLNDNVSAHRLQHILGVEKMSIELARCHQIDEKKAGQAGLMHDLAKFFKPQKLLQIAQEEGLEIDSVCQINPHLLHADVSAIVAKNQFKVTDKDILAAIANHTLGSPEMNELSCIVFIADALEPNRGNTQELETLRQISRKDLYQAVQQTCDYSLKYLLNSSIIIHPRTVLTRNWALEKVKEKTNPSNQNTILC